MTTKTIFCVKLKKEAEALATAPMPGELGQQLLQQVSKAAWKMWLEHQTMLINEYRLNLIDPKARDFLRHEMKQYFWGNGSEKPQGFSPE